MSSRRWYELACGVVRAPSHVLEECFQMNKQTRCHLRAIARLHPEIGNLCDQLEAPWNAVRRIAHAPGAAAQWERAEQVLGQLVEKRRATAPRRSRLEAARLEALKRMGPPMEGGGKLASSLRAAWVAAERGTRAVPSPPPGDRLARLP
ncbi:hypothetical protein WMF11_09420 [Sorangium sp. So ce295]|uniref:hypothetical protein n=1 Tax=Sorangium sp. So ce295 TaxID=3133295 RepID=UPI003F62A8D4